MMMTKKAPAKTEAPQQEVKKEELSSEQVVAKHLQDISVTIVSKGERGFGGGEGSGVIKTRQLPNGEYVNFVWTAAHVVSNLRHEKSVIDSKSGGTKTVVEFDDAMVVKALNEDGRMVGKIEFYAEVIRYNAEEDLALLRLRKKDFIRPSVKFYVDEKNGKPLIPPVGTKLLHVGSLLGQLGSNSMTEGIMSQHGRLLNKMVFDQTTVTAFPGSSGGGVYLSDGQCVGLVLRGAGETFNLIAPVRRIHEWAKRANVDWAVCDSTKMPTDEELRKLPVEDTGVSFSYAASDKAPGKHSVEMKTFGSGTFHLGNRETELRYPTFYHLFEAPAQQMKKSDE
jgi:hypothetical protein